MSTELFKHREALKQEKDNKINDFVIPIFSAVVSLSITYYSKNFQKNDLIYFFYSLCAFFVVLFLLKIIVPLISKYYSIFLNNIKKIDIEEIKSNNDIENLTNDFNYDVTNRIYFSYSLISENECSDLNLKKYYFFESFFYFEKSLDALKIIFNEKTVDILITDNESYIHTYRIENAFEMLSNIFYIISKSEYSCLLSHDLINAKATYNGLAIILSKSRNNIIKIKQIE